MGGFPTEEPRAWHLGQWTGGGQGRAQERWPTRCPSHGPLGGASPPPPATPRSLGFFSPLLLWRSPSRRAEVHADPRPPGQPRLWCPGLCGLGTAGPRSPISGASLCSADQVISGNQELGRVHRGVRPPDISWRAAHVGTPWAGGWALPGQSRYLCSSSGAPLMTTARPRSGHRSPWCGPQSHFYPSPFLLCQPALAWVIMCLHPRTPCLLLLSSTLFFVCLMPLVPHGY